MVRHCAVIVGLFFATRLRQMPSMPSTDDSAWASAVPRRRAPCARREPLPPLATGCPLNRGDEAGGGTAARPGLSACPGLAAWAWGIFRRGAEGAGAAGAVQAGRCRHGGTGRPVLAGQCRACLGGGGHRGDGLERAWQRPPSPTAFCLPPFCPTRRSPAPGGTAARPRRPRFPTSPRPTASRPASRRPSSRRSPSGASARTGIAASRLRAVGDEGRVFFGAERKNPRRFRDGGIL